MKIHSFLHEDTETYTHVLIDNMTNLCAIIDPVLDYDGKSGHTSTDSIDKVISFIKTNHLETKYIIETHAHADHLSAAPYVKEQFADQTIPPQVVIGKHITDVQRIFKNIFNLDMSFKTDASQFDVLIDEGTVLQLGQVEITALYVPGHTPADMAYVARPIKNDKRETTNEMAVFVGDTLFAPDVGTARCDFPGGGAGTLYDSIQRILALPDNTEIYLCHDYPPHANQSNQSRDHTPVTTVAAQKASNIHVKVGISRDEFIKMRTERDATLDMPRLILPAVQVNIQAGELPEPETNGVRYLKVPLNLFN